MHFTWRERHKRLFHDILFLSLRTADTSAYITTLLVEMKKEYHELKAQLRRTNGTKTKYEVRRAITTKSK